jgi:hypothetical protein
VWLLAQLRRGSTRLHRMLRDVPRAFSSTPARRWLVSRSSGITGSDACGAEQQLCGVALRGRFHVKRLCPIVEVAEWAFCGPGRRGGPRVARRQKSCPSLQWARAWAVGNLGLEGLRLSGTSDAGRTFLRLDGGAIRPRSPSIGRYRASRRSTGSLGLACRRTSLAAAPGATLAAFAVI